MKFDILRLDKWVIILVAISLTNWAVALYMLFNLPLNKWVWIVMFILYFITPISAGLSIITTLVIIFKKKINFILGSLIIFSNLAYLIWGLKYLKLIFYVT